MRFVERTAIEDLLVDRTCGDEDEPPDSGSPRRFNEPNRAHDVLLDKIHQVTLAAAKAAAGMMQGRVDHGIATSDKGLDAARVAQVSLHPFQRTGQFLESRPVACRAIPAPEPVPLADEVRGDVSSDEAGPSRKSDSHSLVRSCAPMFGKPFDPSRNQLCHSHRVWWSTSPPVSRDLDSVP